MNSLIVAIVLITVLFLLILIIKQIIKLKVCAICASISIAWIVLLFLFWKGLFDNPLVIGILMGQSTIGFYYLLERKLKNKWHIFRLPFLLSSIVFIAFFLDQNKFWVDTIIFLLIVWFIFLSLFFMRNSPKIKKTVEQIIACCRDW
ncbi:MAG: hypothetical protein L3J07_01785 [Candidatus Magasanikbacteria bacterium]|nr:hypothetical protein [Candidatus Magasanikbacteria bacterium]